MKFVSFAYCDFYSTKCSFIFKAFEGRATQISSSFHTKQSSRKRKSLPSAPKCTCCNLKTGSATSDEQTKTILTHTLRELVPKLSRICIGQNPYSSSQIWTADEKPPGWPSENGIKWWDPNNNPKDSLEVLQKKMSCSKRYGLTPIQSSSLLSSSLSISLIGSGDELSQSLSKESSADTLACSSCDVTLLKSRCCHKVSRSLCNFRKICYSEVRFRMF